MTFDQLAESAKLARQHKQTAENAYNSLDTELARMPKEGYTPEYLAKKTAEIREKFVPVISNALVEVQKLSNQVMTSKPFWENRELILSGRAVSERASGYLWQAKDAAVEAVTRQSLMMEFSKMSNELLGLKFHAAAANNEPGIAFLAHLENHGRAGQPGHVPFDLTIIPMMDQEQALSNIAEIKAIEVNLENVWRHADGRKVTPEQKIYAARLDNEVKR